MNTGRSVAYGWLALSAAGAGAYYLAKQAITDEKRSRVTADRAREAQQEQLRQQEARFRATEELRREQEQQQNAQHGSWIRGAQNTTTHSDTIASSGVDADIESSGRGTAGSREAVGDGQRVLERSKYAATEVYRSPKGNRLS